jgi:hypothetical protein
MTRRNKILTALIFGLLALGCFVSAASSIKLDRHFATVVACVGGVSFVISALVSYSAWRRNLPSACPKCGNPQRAKLSPEEKGECGWDLLITPKFRVFALEKCAACGHIWEPLAPRWLLILGIPVGICVTVFGIFEFFDKLGTMRDLATDRVTWPAIRAVSIIIIGGATTGGCIRRLRKRSRPLGVDDL